MKTPTQSILDGYKQTELGVIPNDWQVNDLGEVGEIKMCRRIFNHETTESGIIPFYKIGTFGKEPDAYISEEQYELYRRKFSFPKKGDILISAAGTIGRTIVYDGKPAYFQDSNIVWIDNNGKLLTNEYLYYVFQIVKYNTEGGTIQRLYNSIIKSAKFICPPEPQQKVIYSVLSDIDKLIKQLEKLIVKKKAIKQGAMQELLTGKRRLPGFSGEWNNFSLFQLADRQKDLFNDGDWIEARYLSKNGIRLIQTGNIGVGCFYNDTKKYISQDSFNALKCKEVRVGDILICRLADPAGRACLMPNIEDRKMITSVDVTIFRPLNSLAERNFLVQTFSQDGWFYLISELCGGSTRSRIARSSLGKIEIKLPSVNEQKVISKILVDMDSEINKLEQKLEKYNQIKQGAMQVLLTGKIRLIKN